MKDCTKRRMIKIAKDLGINNVEDLCDGVRDLLCSYQEIKNIEIARRTILDMQDEL